MKLRLLLSAALFLASVLPAQARPVSVTLYPSGALVTEEETVRPEAGVVLTLPAGADAESLSVSLSSGVVLESRLKTRGTPSPAMETLEGEMESLRAELSRVAAERESVAAERLFWADPPVSPLPGDRQALKAQAEETRTRLAGLAQRETELSARERTLEKDVRRLEARMETLGRHNAAVQECSLVIDGKGPVTARWTYFLPGASWQPSYRVTAEEETGKVRVLMNAVMRQDSGADWTDVDVTLASAEDLHSVEPPELPVWTEGGERPVMRQANLMAARSADAKAPAVQDHATGLRWLLGRMDIPAEGKITRPVAVHEFPAVFCRLVRPLQDTRAYVTASLLSENVPLLPSGQALFLVNGTENARGFFRMAPGRKDLFFGVDQLVTVKTHELTAKDEDARTSGKTRQWRWRTDIANGHDRTVDVRAESAAPILRDASMSARAKSRPAAEFNEERACYEWRLEVPAHGETTITHEVSVTSPAEPSGDKN
ncbi:DUF4139 domain-containing protein [uncultured Mailhella sp.]|uniref:DUF4139 domain-containing protein n=1 Tax=uncultured Mailhella sp. TaxID=1981031 RepID=UPI0025F7D5E6|nr:DUF4139 domain-containing protein [uncultured Mailhella sp.]